MSLNKSLIAFVTDKKMAHDQAYALVRKLAGLKATTSIEVIPGDCTDDELLLKFQAKPFSVILLPWHRYCGHRYQLASKIEGGLGVNRLKGPVLAGYFGETTALSALETEGPSFGRAVLLDLNRLEPREICQFIGAMLTDESRTGVTHFVDSIAPVFTDIWVGSDVLAGNKADMVLALPQIQAQEVWKNRQGAIRNIVTQLWSLVYQEGPGRSTSQVKSYFQLALDSTTLVFRFIYTQPRVTSKDFVTAFWPKSPAAFSPQAELLRHADWLRIHTISDTTEIEITVGLFASASSQKYPDEGRSLWIDPTSKHKIVEIPDHPKDPRLKPFTEPSATVKATTLEMEPSKDRFMFEAAVRIKNLQKVIAEKEELIQELRSGGVGAPQTSPPPPDIENLLEAFTMRFTEFHYQLEQLAKYLDAARASRASAASIEAAEAKYQQLQKKEAAWMAKLTQLQTLSQAPVHKEQTATTLMPAKGTKAK